MGQASVLSNPLDEPGSTSTLVSTDDLLSQLAGEEIDRLLAEGEAERAAASASLDAASDAANLEAQSASDASALQPVDLVELEPPPTAIESAPAAPIVASPAPDQQAAIQASATPAVPPAPPLKPQPKPQPDATTVAAGRAAVNAEPERSRIETTSEEGSAENSLPLYLKPLEWLNAPLTACPQRVREALGKVAIVTFVNAVAVLFYVMLFRKP